MLSFWGGGLIRVRLNKFVHLKGGLLGEGFKYCLQLILFYTSKWHIRL